MAAARPDSGFNDAADLLEMDLRPLPSPEPMVRILDALAWLDLQSLRVRVRVRGRGCRMPSVDVLLPEARTRVLLRWHLLAAIALAIAAAWPGSAAIRFAALALVTAYGLTCLDLLALWHRARRFAVAAQTAGPPLVGESPDAP